MLRSCLACFLLTSAIAASQAVQASPSSVATGQQAAPQQSTVGPDDPVITINAFCADPLAQENACKTVVTRAKFEQLVEGLQPDMPLPLRLKVANNYARNVRMAAQAEARGLDKTAAFGEVIRFARMQLLAQDLDRALKAEANNISDNEIANYYERNKSFFEQATLARLFVPHSSQIAPGTRKSANDEAHENAPASVMSNLAADLRARAAKGEDMDKLQIEAYARAGIERSTADTKMEKVRRATLPPQHESVMDLRPGDVSGVFSDPQGGHFIYKILAKETLTLEDAKEEIRTAISTERYRDSVKGFQGNVVFSDAYFNPPDTTPDSFVRGHKTKTNSALHQQH